MRINVIQNTNLSPPVGSGYGGDADVFSKDAAAGKDGRGIPFGDDSVSISRQGRRLSDLYRSQTGGIDEEVENSPANDIKPDDGSLEGAQSDDKPDRAEVQKPGDKKSNGEELSEEEKRQVEKLRQRDQKVRAHEQAHLSAAGGLAMGGAHYAYQNGPDGKQYAVGGEVGLKVPDAPTPEEDLQIAVRLERAALAPADPSPQDRAIANQARRKASQARREITEKNTEKLKATTDNGVIKAKAIGGREAAENEIQIEAVPENHPISPDYSSPENINVTDKNAEKPDQGAMSAKDIPNIEIANQIDHGNIIFDRGSPKGIDFLI